MTRVKVCGVTRVEDALFAGECGAAMIGLNFYPLSPRCVVDARAVEIAAAVRGRFPEVKMVGVFVRAEAARLAAVDERVGLDLLQFHGDEAPEALAPFGARAIKVWRWERRPTAGDLAPFAPVWGFLLDRKDPAYGGTGEAWDFAAAAALPTEKPVLLAGGIGPDNVRAAVAAARPWGIDVCSRVESAPGIKDRALLEALFREIRHGETQSA